MKKMAYQAKSASAAGGHEIGGVAAKINEASKYSGQAKSIGGVMWRGER